MRTTVWENLQALYPGTVDPNTGEAFNPIVDPLFTKQAIDRYLNEALTSNYLDIVENGEEIFADEEVVDILANQTEYQLPTDLAQVRGLWWKNAHTPLSQFPENQRVPMFKVDDMSLVAAIDIACRGPLYRLQIDSFVLEETPLIDNEGGVKVRYIKWVQQLAQDLDIIEGRFAQVLQECIILKASISCASRKAFMDSSELRTDYTEYHDKLILAARNYNMPTSVQLAVPHPVRLRGAAHGRARVRRFMA